MILHRHGQIAPEASEPRTTPQRFAHPHPNDLWQLDFMGHLPLAAGRLHPLCLLDDHSRYCLGVWACANEQRVTVWTHLTDAFARFGLPLAILTDNGPPWGAGGGGGITALEAELIQLGITVRHGRPHHPQTQGKIERFHQTLGTECTRRCDLADLESAQRFFTAWRQRYNCARPHEALDNQGPAARYQPSPRSYPGQLPDPTYGPDDAVRLVRTQGSISFQNRIFFISRGLIGRPVGIRPTATDGRFAVFFCHQQVDLIDLRDQPKA
jgi:transposase InsO family protein